MFIDRRFYIFNIFVNEVNGIIVLLDRRYVLVFMDLVNVCDN